MNKKWHGIVKNGKFIPDDLGYFSSFAILNGKRTTVTVGPERKDRSLPQNKYLNGVVYKLIGDHLGMTRNEVHDTMRAQFLLEYRQGCPPIVRSTADLSTVEFEEYCSNVRMWAAEVGVYIPLPNEVEL